jgi:hypothetical protein
MNIQTSRRDLSFRRIALRPQRDQVAPCKPREQKGLPANMKSKSEWLRRNPPRAVIERRRSINRAILAFSV